MIIKEVLHAPYELQFAKPLVTSKTTLTSKKGFLIKLVSGKGAGCGDVSPLPLFNTENYDDAIKCFGKIKSKLINMELKNGNESIVTYLDAIDILPTVRFGIEQAIIEILMRNGTEPFGTLAPNSVSVNALVSDAGNIKKVIDEGYETIKLKIGAHSFDEDIKLIERINNNYPNVKLRLDANGKWTYGEAADRLEELNEFEIEYIEDPTNNIEDMIKLCGHSETPIAIDEPIRSLSLLNKLINESPIKFFVIKPALLGNIFGLADVITKAEDKGKSVIISSAFESVAGRNMLVMLAALCSHKYAHGLGVSGYIANDVSEESYPVNKDRINFDITKYPHNYKLDLNFR